MPSRILIGVDGSEDGDGAFNFYADYIHKPEQEALLVYVVKPLVISSNEMALYVNGIREKSKYEEQVKVKQLKETYEDKMRAYEIRGKINIIYYSKKPGKILCQLAHEEHCTLMIIGCRRNGKGSLGPTTDYVLRKAPCSVSLAPFYIADTFDSHSRFEEYLSSRRSSKESVPRLRRVSCPVVASPPLVPEQAFGAAGVCGKGGGGGAVERTDNKFLTVPGAIEAMAGVGKLPVAQSQPQHKQRRHSSVVSMFHQLGFHGPGRKKSVSSTPEEEEEKVDITKC